MKFKKGDKLVWKNSGVPAYEKLDNEDFGLWVSLDSKYLVPQPKFEDGKPVLGKDGKQVFEDVLRPETEKPVEKRFGFKWTDAQVFEYYKGMMNFERVEDFFLNLSPVVCISVDIDINKSS